MAVLTVAEDSVLSSTDCGHVICVHDLCGNQIFVHEYTLCLKKTGTPLKLIVSRIQVHKIRRIFYQKNCKPIRRKS